MTADEIRFLLARKCQEAGGQAEWGRHHGFDRRYVNDIIAGRRNAGERMLKILGCQKRVIYDLDQRERTQP